MAEKFSGQITGMCPHGNYPSTCRTCQAERKEFTNMNAGYNVMTAVREHAGSGNAANVRQDMEGLDAVIRYVREREPELPKDEKTVRDGVYSPGHMMEIAARFAKETLSAGKPEDMGKVRIAADQASRLMAHGNKRETRNVHSLTRGTRAETFELPNLIELPDEWRRSPDGKKLSENIATFQRRRMENKMVDKADMDLLEGSQRLVMGAFSGVKVDKETAETTPNARDLLLINLGFLSGEARKSAGKEMEPTRENRLALLLSKGLFSYKKGSELEQRIRPGIEFVGSPVVIEQPLELRT
jgi:hypothetical protein